MSATSHIGITSRIQAFPFNIMQLSKISPLIIDEKKYSRNTAIMQDTLYPFLTISEGRSAKAGDRDCVFTVPQLQLRKLPCSGADCLMD